MKSLSGSAETVCRLLQGTTGVCHPCISASTGLNAHQVRDAISELIVHHEVLSYVRVCGVCRGRTLVAALRPLSAADSRRRRRRGSLDLRLQRLRPALALLGVRVRRRVERLIRRQQDPPGPRDLEQRGA